MEGEPGSGTVTISICMTLSVDIGLECWCADMQALCTNLNKAKRTEYNLHNKLKEGWVLGMNTFKNQLNPLWATLVSATMLAAKREQTFKEPEN
jgi:hypothetical protein